MGAVFRLWEKHWRVYHRSGVDGRAGAVSCDSLPTESRSGFALLVVMIVVLALSLMFGAVLQSTRQSNDEAIDRVERLKMTAALDGALVSTAYELSLAQRNFQLGEPKTYQVGSYTVTETVRPELSKLDINFASVESLKKLLEASGVPSDRADVLSGNIGAWRDNLQQSPVGQARPSRPFETWADLSHVGGVDLAACLHSDVTVFTGTPDIDPSLASERLRKAIYGNTDQPERRSSYDSVVGGEAARPDLYEVTEEARDSEHRTSLWRQTILRIVPGSRRALWILDQEYQGTDNLETLAACARLSNHAR